MEHSPGYITSWVTNQTSVNLIKLKSYRASSPTTMLWCEISTTRKKKNCKKHKHMEIKQHVSKKPIGYWINQKGKQKISRNKWQWKHDNSKPMGCSKSSFFVPFIFISWRLTTLQHCSGSCHTLTWISHGFTCIPHPNPPCHLPLYLIPLSLPSAPGPSTCLMHPTWAGDLFHHR